MGFVQNKIPTLFPHKLVRFVRSKYLHHLHNRVWKIVCFVASFSPKTPKTSVATKGIQNNIFPFNKDGGKAWLPHYHYLIWTNMLVVHFSLKTCSTSARVVAAMSDMQHKTSFKLLEHFLTISLKRFWNPLKHTWKTHETSLKRPPG